MNKIFAMALTCFLSNVFASESLEINNPWIREAPPSARNLAGYVELRNKGTNAITITSASSPVFAKVELHVTSFENGMMRMKQIETLTIQPGETIYFEPGGKHFMLINPNTPIKDGLSVPVTLKQQSGEDTLISFMVRK